MPLSFPELRASEFSRLDQGDGQVYLDFTGSALYPRSLVQAQARSLADAVLGNPHSESPASARATRLMEDARRAVLEFFHGDPAEYAVVFTGNASAALKLVGESFPFGPGTRLLLTADNHNSVNGLREYARARGANVTYLPLDRDLRLAGENGVPALPPAGSEGGLFAYPAQSNFSGVRHPLDLIARAQDAGYRVVLDAAAFVPTNPLDLDAVQPDFMCVSFYKMFGWPTGVGALIARHDALGVLRRPWFAGGTVEYASVQHVRHRLQSSVAAFEDGTPNFLAIVGVPQGLAFLRQIGLERIRSRLCVLTDRLLAGLGPIARVYGPASTAGRGATVAFNLLDRDGSTIPYWMVERAAADANVSLRGGCFCNPGAAEAAFQIDPEAAGACFDTLGPGRFNPQRFSQCLEDAPVGAVRASLGIPSNEHDIDRLITLLHHQREAFRQ